LGWQTHKPNGQFGVHKSGFDRTIEAAFSLAIKNACQLEGSDHGGRDSAAELALAGTIDVQASDISCNRLTLGPAPIRQEKLYSAKKFRQRNF
jgi:hypothetical protein